MNKFEALNAVCDSFYDIGGDPGGWRAPLGDVARIVGGLSCDVQIVRDGQIILAQIGATTLQELSEKAYAEYQERFFGIDPRSRFLDRARQGVVATDLQFVDVDVMKTNDYYADFLLRHGGAHAVIAAPLKTRNVQSYFGIHLASIAGPPNEEQFELITSIQPHLNRALRTYLHLSDAYLANELYSHAFDNLGRGVVILGDRRRILSDNKTAREILGYGSPLRTRNRRLEAADAGDDAKLKCLASNAANRTGALGGARIFVGRDGRRLGVMICPTPVELRERTGAAAFVFLTVVEDELDHDWSAILGSLFQLSASEARVASFLVNGQGIREISNTLGLTYESARSFVKCVYAKAGVHRQNEFVALVRAAVPPSR